MEKKRRISKGSIVVVAVVLAVICIGIYLQLCQPTGTTVEGREEQLNASIATGTGWQIASELTLNNYLICGAYSSDEKACIAIFTPTENGGYRFQSSTNRNRDEIITAGAMVNDTWYDFIWFMGAQTEYAEVTYTVDRQIQPTLQFDTTDMGIVNHPAPGKEYTLTVCYYDSQGNQYQ